ncbi:MAG: type 4a pilus biogenesis protein PilO [Thiotrichales bacterium]
MNLAELKNFDLSDLNRIGLAPAPVRYALGLIVLLLIGALGFYLLINDQIAELETSRNEEATLRTSFEKKYQQAANLEAYKAQLSSMEREFGDMLRQLPSDTEIDAVVLDVSQTGLASGLKIQLFKPLDEAEKGFYAEKPIQIKLRGTYAQMASFASGIAALPRIVTLHDIQIKPDDKNAPQLSMDVTAKTYRYLAEREVETNLKEKKASEKKRTAKPSKQGDAK